ncbi:MAG: DUF4831 family protein [Prosthecobacter sp.]|uniref:DUF4831 family protein n=1 Tax=Prosthecobacter sp. TaxID=1965333 RepID=UPI003BB05120
MKSKLKILTVLVLFLSGCASTTEVVPVSQFKGGKRKGIVYSLPKTIIGVEVPVTEKALVAAKDPYFKVAKEIFGEEPNLKETVSYKVGKPVLTFRAERDGARTFVAKIKQAPFSSHSTALSLSGEGVLTDGTMSDQNKTVDYAVTTVEAAAKIAASAAKAASVDPNSNDFKNYDPKIQLKLQELAVLKQNRTALFVSASPDASKFLEKIDGEISAIMALFLGTTKISTASLFFEVEPRHLNGACAAAEDVDLFELDASTGNVNVHTRLIAPAPGFLHFKSRLPKDRQRIHLMISSSMLFTADELAQLTYSKGASGIHYCIPGKAQVQVRNNNKVMEQKSSLIAQYGPVVALPNSTGSEKTDISATLDPLTGALLKVNVTGQAFDPKYIERLGNAVNTVEAAQVDKHNREALANDELTQLKRQKDILQTKSDISKLKTELEAAKIEP